MKDVGIREFRDHASSYLSAGEPLMVRKHGKVVGFYLPVKRRSGGEEVVIHIPRFGFLPALL